MSVVESALTSVDRALSAAADARQSAEKAAAQERADLRHQYLSLLVRAKNPKPGDDAKLAELILGLGLTVKDVRGDSKRIEDAERAIGIVSETDERHAAHREAIAARDELAERHRQEMDAATRRVNEAGNSSRQAGWASKDLHDLYRECPGLFVEGLLTLPDLVLVSLSKQQAAPKVERREPLQQKWINGKWHEALLGADGRYLRDGRGGFVYPVKQQSEPLLDDRGRPVVDRNGKLVFPKPAEDTPPQTD
jgi:hypothetical protein